MAEQDGDVVAAVVDDGKIEKAIAVEVACDHGDGACSSVGLTFRKEEALAIVLKDGHLVCDAISNHDIRVAVGIEGADCDRERIVTNRVESGAAKGPLTAAQYGGKAIDPVDDPGDDKILIAIPIEICGRYCRNVRDPAQVEGNSHGPATCAIADEQGSIVGSGGVVVDGEDVERASIDEVCRDHGLVVRQAGKALGRLEGTIAVAEQNIEVAGRG